MIRILIFIFWLSVYPMFSSGSFPSIDSTKAAAKWGQWLKQFDLKTNETILSLGCGGAWREFELSLLTDSLTFYLEELDSISLNSKIISKNILEFKNNRKRQLTNTFFKVYGTTTSIPVQNDFFEKVLIMNSFHHFDSKEVMLKEINRALKTKGILIITDHISLDVSKESSYGCDHKYFLLNEKDLISLIEKSNFKLISITKMAKQTRLFVFKKN